MNPINNVVKMYERVRNSSDNDANFLAIVTTLIDNGISSLNDEVNQNDYNDKKTSLKNYILEKSRTANDAEMFVEFCNKYMPNIINKIAIVKSLNTIVSSNYGNVEEKIEKLKNILEPLSVEDFKDILLVREKEENEDNYSQSDIMMANEEHHKLQNNIFTNTDYFNIVIDKIGDINFIFENKAFFGNVNYSFLRKLNNYFSEKELLNKTLKSEMFNKDGYIEIKETNLLDFLLTITLTDSRYGNKSDDISRRKYIREFIYKDCYPHLDEEIQLKIKKEIPLYVKSIVEYDNHRYPEFEEIMHVPEWYKTETNWDKDEKVNTFDLVLNNLIKREMNHPYYVGFSGLIEKINDDNNFKKFIFELDETFFNKVLNITTGSHYFYLDKSFELSNKQKITSVTSDILFGMDKKIAKIIEKYGISHILGDNQNAFNFLKNYKVGHSVNDEKKWIRIVEEFKKVQEQFGKEISTDLNKMINWCQYIKYYATDNKKDIKKEIPLPTELPSGYICVETPIYKNFKHKLPEMIKNENEFVILLEKRELQNVLVGQDSIKNRNRL